MKLEDQVITSDQAKRLKELRIDQEATWYWWDHSMSSGTFLGTEDLDDQVTPRYAAYTVSELGVMLPEKVKYKSWGECLVGTIRDNGSYYCRLTRQLNDIVPIQSAIAPTEAEARAEMLIHLLESGSITADEVNQRLQQ